MDCPPLGHLTLGPIVLPVHGPFVPAPIVDGMHCLLGPLFPIGPKRKTNSILKEKN